MPFWQRSLVLLVAVLIVSFVFSIIWQQLFGFALPGYILGVVGGLTAVPLWDLLKRIRPRD